MKGGLGAEKAQHATLLHPIKSEQTLQRGIGGMGGVVWWSWGGVVKARSLRLRWKSGHGNPHVIEA